MRAFQFLAVSVAALLLVACGGGGGGCGGGGGGGSGRGAFSLSGTSASFTTIQGLPMPAAQTFTMTVTGSGVAAVGVAYAAGQTPASWLQIELTGTGPYTLSVRPLVGMVAPGTYTATFLVGTGDSSGNVLQSTPFTVTYTLEPPLSVSTTGIGLRYTFGAANRREILPITVTAPDRQWTVVSNQPWLTVPAGSQNGSTIMNATVDVTGLAPGSYSATLNLANSAVASDAATITVLMTIDPARFEVGANEFVFGGADGRSALDSQPLNFSLATGDGLHPYTVDVKTDSGGQWLTVNRTTGTVGAAGTSLTLGIDRGQLAGGTYTGEVTVSTIVYGMPFSETIPVTLNIEAHRLVVTSSGVALSRVAGRDVLTRTLKVFSNLGIPSTQWTATSDAAWLTVTSAGLVGDDLVLTANPAGLAANTTHFATVTISSPTPHIENTQTVRVGLYVSNAAPVDEAVTLAARSVAASPVEPLFAITVEDDVQLRNVYTNAVVRTLNNVVAQPGRMTFSEDGRTLFIHDLANERVTEVDTATGAVLGNFPTPKDQYAQQGTGIAVMHPDGHPILVAPNLHFIDLVSRQEIHNQQWSFTGFGSFTPSPDQSLLAFEQGSAWSIEHTALNGGDLVLHANVINYPIESYSRESCFSPDGALLYAGAHEVGPYIVAGVSVETRAVVQRFPAHWWGNALQCSWNGLIVGGFNTYVLFDLFVYDGGSETVLAERNSDLSDGTYYPQRQIADYGLAISGDGTRLLSIYSQTGAMPVGAAFQTLPPPP